ncbi:DNA primase [Candidatus Kaiserbacteria bacterium]|nr:DNA primase [Candidatus Kaiserbacteria bacterium]
MASGDAVQQIKERLSIVDVISPYVELHAAGKNLKGKSPFTNEKTPSFYVSPDRGMYYCFSSSQGGDMFTFIEKMEGVDFKGALTILAEKANVQLVPEDPQKRTQRDTQYAVLEAATVFAEEQLQEHSEARAYITDRGVEEKTIRSWRIGYVPGPPKHGWRHMREHLLGKGFGDAELMKAGLTKAPGEGKAPYDVFRDRIMFPIRDTSGRVVAFSGRILTKDSEAPKYVNSPETELFNKSEILFGYDKAKEGIRKFDFSLIVEGQFDVVLAHQAGYTNTVAVSGTALTPHHVSLLQRLSNRVVLALDADRAGIAAVKRAADIMLARGMDLKVAELPDGKDPADLIKEGKDEFKKVIGKATHVIEFLLHLLLKAESDDRKRKLRLFDEVLPYIVKLESHVDQDHFMGVVAKALSVPKDAVARDVERLREKVSKTMEQRDVSTPIVSEPEASAVDTVKHSRRQAVLATLLVFTDLLSDREVKVIETQIKQITGSSIENLREEVPAEVMSQLIFTLENDLSSYRPKQIHEEVCDRLNELRQIVLRTSLRHSKETLEVAERAGDNAQVEELMREVSKYQQELGEPPLSADIFV